MFGQLSLDSSPRFAFIPSDGHLDCACVSGLWVFLFVCVCLRVLGFEVGGRLLTVTISSGPLMPLPKRPNGRLGSLRLVGPHLCLS